MTMIRRYMMDCKIEKDFQTGTKLKDFHAKGIVLDIVSKVIYEKMTILLQTALV